MANIVHCFNFTLKNVQNLRTRNFVSPFYFKNYRKPLKIKVPTAFAKVKNLKNDTDDNTSSVRISVIPIYPLRPASVAFLLI